MTRSLRGYQAIESGGQVESILSHGEVALKHGPPEEGAPYPFSVPQICSLQTLDVNVPVTFFVGENGSGKSTLLEGIAAAAELPSIGTSQVAADDTLAPARQLGAALRLAWSQKSRKGFFLRAEDFFGSLRARARDDARISRELGEALGGVRADVPRPIVVTGSHADEHEAGAVVARYDTRSHGESFMDLFTERIRPGGLYLLDEPEAPLSPRRQIAFLDVLTRTAKAAAQFIIATHSPSCSRALEPGSTASTRPRSRRSRTRSWSTSPSRVTF